MMLVEQGAPLVAIDPDADSLARAEPMHEPYLKPKRLCRLTRGRTR
jgi:hypothetical protein